MKNVVPVIAACWTIIAALASTAATAEPISESRVWTEVYPVSTATPQLTIDNIWGSVRIRPGPGGQISVTVDEKRSAPDQALFERSLDMLKLHVAAGADGVSFTVGERERGWHRVDNCNDCRVDYQFDVLVPVGTVLDVGTIIDGRVDVADIAGTVSASNVNGPIAIREARDCDMIRGVNGAIELSFMQAPGNDCKIETVNGDVTISMPDGSGLDVAIDTFNGRTISEFDVQELALPARIEETREEGRQRYRIEQSAGIRLEGGGPTFSISSLNGDIRIQKKL